MSTRSSSAWLFAGAIGAATLLSLGGCSEKKFKGAMILGGEKVSSDKLEHGREVYTHFCRPCHGDDGDGRGASSSSLRPPPRDFRAGMFKFGSVTTGLPSDDDFKRIIRYGLKGTAMLPWDLDDTDLGAVIPYIKTFSPRWQPAQPDPKTKKLGPGFKQGEVVKPCKRDAAGACTGEPYKDPWMDASRELEGIERGKYLFHVKAQCGSCHPNYVTRQELSDMNVKASGAPLTEFRDDMYGSTFKESQYEYDTGQSCTAEVDCKSLCAGILVDKDRNDCETKGFSCNQAPTATAKTCKHKLWILPPDFTRTDVRSVRVQLGKVTALEDLYRVIAGGINGTPMPSWRGTAFEAGHESDGDLFAIAHYVYSLVLLKGTPAAVELQMKLANQPPYVPPPPPPEPTPTPSPEPTTDGASSAAPSTSTSAAPSVSASSIKPSGGLGKMPGPASGGAKPGKKPNK